MTPEHVFAAAALLLQYPDDDTMAVLPQVSAILTDDGGVDAMDLMGCATWLAQTPLLDAQAHYVGLFDRRRRACLYLSYYLNGDTRRRGMALLAFKQVYQHSGWQPVDDELPDFLPTVLQFAAVGNLSAGLDLLADHRAGLVVLEQALRDARSPYTGPVTALARHVPQSAGTAERAEQLISDGPPAELVGLEPFGITQKVGV